MMGDHPTKKATPMPGSTEAESKKEVDQIRESRWAKDQPRRGPKRK